MKTLNKVMLLGSVGKDPEIKSTGGGTTVANFSIATSERFKDKQGNWTDQTEWHNLVAFGRTAEVVRDYVKKGSPVHIEGRLQTDSWEKDGVRHYRTKIIIDSLIMLGGKKQERDPIANFQPSEPEISDDDVPF